MIKYRYKKVFMKPLNYIKVFFLSLIINFLTIAHSYAAVNFELGIQPVIQAEGIVEVEKNIIFDGSKSFVPLPEEVNGDEAVYEWDFGDQSKTEEGIEVVHTYKTPGEYLVTLSISQGGKVEKISQTVFVYKKLILLVTDINEKKEGIEKLSQSSREGGTFIEVISNYDSSSPLLSEETLAKKIAAQEAIIDRADSIAIWTEGNDGINALTSLARQKPELKETLGQKTIINITEENLSIVSRIFQSSYDIIKPKQIILARQYELRNLANAESTEAFLENLKTNISDYRIIDENHNSFSIWNSVSYLVNFLIIKGIPSSTIILLLMLPVIATIIAFLKQVVGVTTYGLYTPSIITLSFLALGLKFGLSILIIIIVSGSILRRFLQKVRLMHTPRIAIIFCINTLILLITLSFGAYLGVSELATIAVFPMLIMTTLAEKFVSALGGKGFYAATLLMIETTLVALICYWVVEWQFLQTLMLSYPEIILLLLLANLLIGKWTGLRAFEYIRFREVMKHAEE